MENKKRERKTSKKTTKHVAKKATKKATQKKSTPKKKKGFTLIELLAVIIILGILMIIAIPSVTSYINDSRKSAYINTAKDLITGTRNIINEGKLKTFDLNVTYFIDGSCIPLENAYKSPYDDFEKAYVVVTYNGNGFDYYWTSVDKAGQGIKKITREDKLNEDSIESDLKSTDILTNIGIDGRKKSMLIDKSTNCQSGEAIDVFERINGETGEIYVIPAHEVIGELTTLVNVGGARRFVGKNPDNYVLFNGQKWRIIGLYGNYLKIESTFPSGFQYNDSIEQGNNWSSSVGMNYLNNQYYNSLSSEAKSMIYENAEWNVGKVAIDANASSAYASAQTTKWTGKVGLLNLYEYLYSVDDSSCYTAAASRYNTECENYTNNWAKKFGFAWIMSPSSSISYGVLCLNSNGTVFINGVTSSASSYPVVYLKPEVTITGGTGTSSDPYKLSIE